MYVANILSAILYAVVVFTSPLQDPFQSQWNKKSTLTIERPVEFPGIVLEPGTYMVRLEESSDKRSKVKILNQDETQVLATLIAVPDHRVRPENDSEFTYHDVKGDGPLPVRSWFFTGDLVGLEFVYPKTRAKDLVKEGTGYVMASNGNSDKDSVIVAMTANGSEIVIDDPNPSQIARKKPKP